jgi:hypothetical protein
MVIGSWQTGRETSYVAMSRAREATYVFTDYSSLRMETHDRDTALKELTSRASESQAKVSALDVMEKEKARTEGIHMRSTPTAHTAMAPVLQRELGTPRPTPLPELEQQRRSDDVAEALQRQARGNGWSVSASNSTTTCSESTSGTEGSSDDGHGRTSGHHPSPPPSVSTPLRPGRRRGRRPLSDADGALCLEAQTIKAYRLGDEARRTVGYLRRIVNQRRIPDEARVAIDGERITIEWADE